MIPQGVGKWLSTAVERRQHGTQIVPVSPPRPRLNRRQKAFIDAYVTNGFNATSPLPVSAHPSYAAGMRTDYTGDAYGPGCRVVITRGPYQGREAVIEGVIVGKRIAFIVNVDGKRFSAPHKVMKPPEPMPHDAFLLRCASSTTLVHLCRRFGPGDPVRVTEGPHAGREATVTHMAGQWQPPGEQGMVTECAYGVDLEPDGPPALVRWDWVTEP